MSDYLNTAIPSKPEVISETSTEGTYKISGLYPGYGNTLGNALRRMLLSSIPGTAITAIRIKGALHEFSTVEGVKEDALTMLLNVKNIRVRAETDTFPQTISLKKKGKGMVTAGDFEVPGQLEIINKELFIAEITNDKAELSIEADVQRGIGFCPRESLKEDAPVGSIVVDAVFSPVKRASYEVHNMRVGDRIDFNALDIFLETDGSISPRQALERVIKTMMAQFEAMLGFQSDGDERIKQMEREAEDNMRMVTLHELNLSAAVASTLEKNNILTVMDILKKGLSGIREVSGIGDKAVEEIKERLEEKGIVLKNE